MQIFFSASYFNELSVFLFYSSVSRSLCCFKYLNVVWVISHIFFRIVICVYLWSWTEKDICFTAFLWVAQFCTTWMDFVGYNQDTSIWCAEKFILSVILLDLFIVLTNYNGINCLLFPHYDMIYWYDPLILNGLLL